MDPLEVHLPVGCDVMVDCHGADDTDRADQSGIKCGVGSQRKFAISFDS